MKQTATFILRVEIDATSDEKRDEAIRRIPGEILLDWCSVSKDGSYDVIKRSCVFESIEATT